MSYKIPRNFSISEDELVYRDTKILSLVEKHGSPLRVNVPEVFSDNFKHLKQIVNEELTKRGIDEKKFELGYAIKANQHARLVNKAIREADFIEASSRNDLILLENALQSNNDQKILCHGFKTKNTRYCKKILELSKSGFKIIPVVDSVEELTFFLEQNNDLEIGIRLNSSTTQNDKNILERFGITEEELADNIEKIKHAKHIKLTTIHIHAANTIKDINKRIDDYGIIFRTFKLLKDNKININNLNFGGGIPTRDEVDDNFYRDLYINIIDEINNSLSIDQDFPTIQTESGRYLAEETQFLILSVLLEKKNNNDFIWYILNGSSINLLPETMLDEEKVFSIIPADNHSKTKTNVVCAGATCDPEDYFNQEPIGLPDLKNFSGNLVIPNTGAYQESLLSASRNYPGHCLIDPPKEITLANKETDSNDEGEDFLKNLGYQK